MSQKSTRREVCWRATLGALAGVANPAFFSWPASDFTPNTFQPLGQSPVAGDNLLTNPRYEFGAKFRLGQFIQRGADSKDAEAIFRRLPDLEPVRWVAEWSRLAEPEELRAAQFESQGNTREAKDAYQKASMYYGIAKFPVINHPAKQSAYRKCIENYRKAARYFDPPLERVVIPFEGQTIIGYLRRPKGIFNPPVVIATGGIDVYKEDRDTSDILEAGLASFSTDMPGNGECPLWYTSDAERFYSAVIDYIVKQEDLDGERIAILGRSYGGYWAAKMAFVENRRLLAAVQWGGPVHYTFQEPWIRHLLEEKLYLWSLADSMIYAHHVKNLSELFTQAPTLSLKTQGWLEEPCAPLLVVNGEKDPWITIQDAYLLLQTGQPKAARFYSDGGHMGGDPGTGKLAMNWLKSQLAR